MSETRVSLFAALALVTLMLAAAHEPGGYAQPAVKPLADGAGDPLPQGAVQRLGSMRFRCGSLPTGLAVSPDGKLLASATYTKIFAVWELKTGKLRHRLEHPKAVGEALFFSSDGKELYTG